MHSLPLRSHATEGSWNFLKFLSIDSTRRLHTHTHTKYSTLTVPSHIHETVWNTRPGTFFPGTFFPETFTGIFFLGKLFRGSFFPGFIVYAHILNKISYRPTGDFFHKLNHFSSSLKKLCFREKKFQQSNHNPLIVTIFMTIDVRFVILWDLNFLKNSNFRKIWAIVLKLPRNILCRSRNLGNEFGQNRLKRLSFFRFCSFWEFSQKWSNLGKFRFIELKFCA